MELKLDVIGTASPFLIVFCTPSCLKYIEFQVTWVVIAWVYQDFQQILHLFFFNKPDWPKLNWNMWKTILVWWVVLTRRILSSFRSYLKETYPISKSSYREYPWFATCFLVTFWVKRIVFFRHFYLYQLWKCLRILIRESNSEWDHCIYYYIVLKRNWN